MTGAATATMLDAALEYIQRDWPVVPVNAHKQPLCEWGQWRYGGQTESAVKDLFSRPAHGLALLLWPASTLAVMDFDGPHAEQAWRSTGVSVPRTARVYTPRGIHDYYRMPPGVECDEVDRKVRIVTARACGCVKPCGVDLLVKGYALAPPTPRYREDPDYVLEPSRIADLPDGVLALMRHATATNTGERFTIAERIPEGKRNTTLYKMARSMKKKGNSDPAILAAVRAENTAKCDPPLPEGEIDQIVKHAIAQPDRPEFAADGNSNGGSDPLAALRALPDSPPAVDIEAALRETVKSLGRVDSLTLRKLRQEMIALLEARKVAGAAGWVDAALSLVADTDGTKGEPADFLADPEPWPELVDGALLLDEITTTLTKYLILPSGAARAIALWVLHAHALAAFAVSPILAVISATMRCGKTTLLSLLSGLLPRALPSANITASVLFRAITKYNPTLLIDEADTFLTLSDELRGVLNAGHTRMGATLRNVGDEHEPKVFRVFGPKVLAMIGKPPATIEDRSIVIPMKRKTSGERAQRFRLRLLEELSPLCRKAARWAQDNLETLRDADSKVPDGLNDRAADNWRGLLAVADLAGGEWPKLARDAAINLSGGDRDPEADGAGVALIGDCVTIFNDKGVDRLSSINLIAELVKLEEKPWPEWSKGKPITPKGVAKLLKPFGIKPKVERGGGDPFRGYDAHDFDDAHSRYYQGSNVLHPLQSNEISNLDPNFNVLQTPDVTHTKSDLTIDKERDVTHVTHTNPENGRNEGVEQEFDATNPAFEACCAADLGDLFDSEEVLL